MAENIRAGDPNVGHVKTPDIALYDECMRQSENCAYSAAGFTIWLRMLRRLRAIANIAPVFFGALATWKIIDQHSPILAAVFSFLAATIPLAYRAARIDHAIGDFTAAAGEYTTLRDRFRMVAETRASQPFTEFEVGTEALFARLDKVRALALTPPEWCFLSARRKMKAGHYKHDYDGHAR